MISSRDLVSPVWFVRHFCFGGGDNHDESDNHLSDLHLNNASVHDGRVGEISAGDQPLPGSMFSKETHLEMKDEPFGRLPSTVEISELLESSYGKVITISGNSFGSTGPNLSKSLGQQ